jgi:hypothetical protein
MEYFVLAVAVFCLPLAGSEDLYWRPNTDWINPNNWKHGRVPCEGDVADFSSVPRGSVIRLDGSATIRSVVLPVGSSIELGKSLTLQFSSKINGPMVAPVEVRQRERDTVCMTTEAWFCILFDLIPLLR